jgi:predicted HTH transcriptional regulator
LYLELGNITHARTNNSVGEYAFFTLMGLKDGKASFEPDEVPPERTISISTEQLILNWSSQKQWNKIKEVIPSPNTFFRALPQKSQESVNLSSDQWNVSALCNGTKTVSEIAQTLNLDAFKISKAIFQLVQLGLLEKGEGRKPVKKKLGKINFFHNIGY